MCGEVEGCGVMGDGCGVMHKAEDGGGFVSMSKQICPHRLTRRWVWTLTTTHWPATHLPPVSPRPHPNPHTPATLKEEGPTLPADDYETMSKHLCP